MNGLPKRVQEQEEEAARLHAQIYGPKGDEDTGSGAPAHDAKDEDLEPKPGETPESATEPKAQEEDQSHDQEPKPEGEATWEQRYRSLDGKYRKEVPQLSQQLREERQRSQALEAELRDIRRDLDDLKQGKAKAEPEPTMAITPDLRKQYEEEYGADFMAVVEAVAKDLLEARLRPIESGVEEARRTASETRTAVGRREFVAELTRLVPNWETVNQEKGWLEWLGQHDPLLGGYRQDALDAFHRQLDFERVAALFEAYLKTKPSSGTAPAKPEIESQIEPSGKGDQPQKDDAPRYTMDDWTRLQEDARKGKYRGREDEFKRLERRIHAALFGNR